MVLHLLHKSVFDPEVNENIAQTSVKFRIKGIIKLVLMFLKKNDEDYMTLICFNLFTKQKTLNNFFSFRLCLYEEIKIKLTLANILSNLVFSPSCSCRLMSQFKQTEINTIG